MSDYDVVVVGAGPGGCMTAKVLSENGFRVALLERKTDMTKLTRACATMVAIENERYFNERMYLNEKNDKIIFPETGFSVKYDGPHCAFYNWNMYSPDGKHTVQLGDYRARESQKQRLSATYSKQHLLEGLLKDAGENGCNIYPSTNVIDVVKTSTGVKVLTKEGKTFEGTFVVAADGINSRIAQITGLNKKRLFYGTMTGLGLYLNNFKITYPNAFNWIAFYHHQNRLPMAFVALPTPYPDAEFWLWGSFISSPPAGGADIMDEVMYLFKNSAYTNWFEKTEIVRYNCHVLNMWSPAPTPFLDNVIFVGDSAWTVEAECTGSMMCGVKAAHAITTAFRDNKLNREGVKSYITWWEDTFPKGENYRDIISLFGLFELLKEEDVNYLFSLLDEKPLEVTLNPYRANQIINGVLMQKMPQIQKENPQFMAKLQAAATIPLEKILAPSVRRAFPNI
ncbi:MAG: FAD-dependent monooxygenase [Deltaproteobacteria bacterium]|nr:FAD-dependent monooxygenase [Deltaproteobacteria bacterium]